MLEGEVRGAKGSASGPDGSQGQVPVSRDVGWKACPLDPRESESPQ